MNRLDSREENILDFIIRDYVASAAPVSSGRIFSTGLFQLSPATIRNAMLRLDEESFLEQPHTSSGRIPTDKAYRYFVDNLMDDKVPPKKERDLLDDLIKEAREQHERLFENFARTLSDELGLFTVVASFKDEPRIGGYGLENVFSEPEFNDRNLTVEFSRLIDNLEQVAEKFLESSGGMHAEVYIGEENPLARAREFSSVVMKFSNDEFGDCVIFSLGPKRMNYEKAASLISFAVKDIIE